VGWKTWDGSDSVSALFLKHGKNISVSRPELKSGETNIVLSDMKQTSITQRDDDDGDGCFKAAEVDCSTEWPLATSK
jgi:hypothetical protein